MRKRDSKARSKIDTVSSVSSLTRGWTEEQDQALIIAVTKYGRDWVTVKESISHLVDKTKKAVGHRATRLANRLDRDKEYQLFMQQMNNK